MRQIPLLLLLAVPVLGCKNSSTYREPVSPGTGLVWEDQPEGILAVNFGSANGTAAGGDRLARLEQVVGALDVAQSLLVESTSGSSVRVTARALQVQGTLLAPVDLAISTAAIGPGGLDSGSVDVNTWYGVIAIASSDGALSAGLLSTTPDAPLLPAGFTKFRRVGWVRSSVGGVLRKIRQAGRFAHYQPGSVPGETAARAKRRIADNRTNATAALIDGGGANESSPHEWFPPGVREVFVKTLVNAVGTGAEVVWAPDATVPNFDETHQRRLCRCENNGTNAVGTPFVSVCETDTWITLNGAGLFYALDNNGTASVSYFIEPEGYLDEGL